MSGFVAAREARIRAAATERVWPPKVCAGLGGCLSLGVLQTCRLSIYEDGTWAGMFPRAFMQSARPSLLDDLASLSMGVPACPGVLAAPR